MTWRCVRGGLDWMLGRSFSPRGCWALEQDPQKSAHSIRLTEFQKYLDKVLRHMVWFWGCPVQDQELDFDDPMGPFLLRIFYISVITRGLVILTSCRYLCFWEGSCTILIHLPVDTAGWVPCGHQPCWPRVPGRVAQAHCCQSEVGLGSIPSPPCCTTEGSCLFLAKPPCRAAEDKRVG